MKLKSKLFTTVLVLTSSAFSIGANAFEIYEGQAKVYRVIDGDTYILNAATHKGYNEVKSLATTKDDYKYFRDKYKSFRVRLANTNTAESVHRDKAKNSAKGEKSSGYVKKLITGKRVAYSCWKMGDFNRVICSIRYNGKDLGIHLIEEGHSPYITYFGKHPYLHSEYKKADSILARFQRFQAN